jgi:hypothetical protein
LIMLAAIFGAGYCSNQSFSILPAPRRCLLARNDRQR